MKPLPHRQATRPSLRRSATARRALLLAASLLGGLVLAAPPAARADELPLDVDGFLAAHPEIADSMVWEFEPAPLPTPTSTPKPHVPRASPTATSRWPSLPGKPIQGQPNPSPTIVGIKPPGGARTPVAGPTPTPTVAPTATPGLPVEAAWAAWPAARQQQLRDNVAIYADWLATGMPLYEAWAAGGFGPEPAGFAAHFDPEIDPDPVPAVYPPTNLQYGYPNGATWDVYPSSQAFDLYVKHVALALALELGGHLPWSLLDLDAAGRAQILDGREVFDFVPAGAGPWGKIKAAGHLMKRTVIPGPPLMVFSFLARHGMLGSTRRQTIERALSWSNVLHHTWGGQVASGASPAWVLFQYLGRPPVTRMMNGTIMTEPVGTTYYPTVKHFVGGCGGFSGFIHALLRVASIPVETLYPDHAVPHFISENLYLSHGDDPYTISAETPAAELLIDQAQYDAWFVTDPDPAHNTGRRASELEIQYLGLRVVKTRCDDLNMIQQGFYGPDHAISRVYTRHFQLGYTVAELEAVGLWDNLDAKIATIPGGCASIPWY